uniref:Uncharacterized protein n=1 Tax=Arundo donax TaxID=35708 RepID=A0A0A9B8Y9_ARUDO
MMTYTHGDMKLVGPSHLNQHIGPSSMDQ